MDLFYTIAHQLLPIEIKAGQSNTSDYLKGLRTFAKLIPDLPYGQLLVYAGAESREVSATQVEELTSMMSQGNMLQRTNG